MKRRCVQTLIAVFVMSSLIVTPVMAEPNDEVQALEIQKSEMESQANSIQSQLVSLLVNYEALQKDIENQGQRITQAEEDLAAAEAKERKQYEDMKLRIQYIYEENEDSLFETLLTAGSFSELMNKAEYIQNVHRYDRQQLQEYIDTKQQVAELKVELEAGQADMEVMAAELSTQQATMESTLANMRSQIADFDSQLEIAKAEAEAQLNQLINQTESVAVASAETGKGNANTSGQTSQTASNKPSGTTSNNAGNTTNSTAGNTSKPANTNTSNTNTANNNTNTNNNANNTKPAATPTPAAPTQNTSKPSNASLGQQIANRACQYIGNPYVYGGNSLTNGVDCSGFVQQIHKLFGISTPRDSWSQLAGGKAVSYSDMLPGDVIVYSGHVAIYIGNNTVVHASNSQPYPAGGIKTTSPANYKTVLGVRRYW